MKKPGAVPKRRKLSPAIKRASARRRRQYTSERDRALANFDKLLKQLRKSFGPRPAAAVAADTLPVVPEGASCPPYPHAHSAPGDASPNPKPSPEFIDTLRDLALLRMLKILNITSESLMAFYAPQVRETLIAKGQPPIIQVMPGVALLLTEGEPPAMDVKPS